MKPVVCDDDKLTTVFAFGGIVSDVLSGAVAVLVGVTGLFGGAARYVAVLTRRGKPDVERATAFGFFSGFCLGVLVLLIDVAT